jgi:hypothetical protein
VKAAEVMSCGLLFCTFASCVCKRHSLPLLLTKGIIRDQNPRRSMMFWLMLAALIMLFLGSVFLSEKWAREHPWLYIGYWFVCGWITLACLLLALMDILIIRAGHRVARRKMESELLSKSHKDPEE